MVGWFNLLMYVQSLFCLDFLLIGVEWGGCGVNWMKVGISTELFVDFGTLCLYVQIQ